MSNGPVIALRHLEIVLDREVGEDAPPLRHVADAAAARRGRAPACAASVPNTLTEPERAGVSPMMLRIVVVLPAPLRPSKVVMLPSAAASETSCRMWLLP